MGYEIDYIPVGDGEKGGDAIALRFGNLSGPRAEQTVVVIDGGFKESGTALVDHIKRHFGTDEVNYVFLTHPDADHASGLTEVLEKLKVGTLVMHKPWEHGEDIKKYFRDGRITASGLEERLEKSLQNASDLEAIAKRKGIPIVEPFQGIADGSKTIHVLGPSVHFYEEMLAQFRQTPDVEKSVGPVARVFKAAEEAVRRVADSMGIDLLDDDEDTTSPENNSSAIIMFSVDGHKLLFTGDAGKTALHNAANYAVAQGLRLDDLVFLDVPHHGSRRNLSSGVLRRVSGTTAYISAPKASPKHPAKKVTNALKKFGCEVFVTRGRGICYACNAPARAGWGPIEPEPFHDVVEE